jgi:hypothetical protein
LTSPPRYVASMTSRKLVASLACLLLVAGAVPASAGRLAACKRACRAAVVQCAQDRTWLKPRRARRQCRAQLLRACRQRGAVACELAPPPTTTTTTTTVPTTSTTSTTVLGVHDFSGTWVFTGAVAENTCPTAVGGVQDSFTIVQTGTTVSVTIASVPGLVMHGTVDATQLQASGTVYDGSCADEFALVAYPDGTFTVTAGTGIQVTCSGGSCEVIWTGSMTRA